MNPPNSRDIRARYDTPISLSDIVPDAEANTAPPSLETCRTCQDYIHTGRSTKIEYTDYRPDAYAYAGNSTTIAFDIDTYCAGPNDD
jgi:hypothetical protein